jgi:para-aminobenzoate synthetase component 1
LSEGEAGASNSKVELKERVTREAYLEAIDSVQAHIQQGDIYEMNHCQEFFAEKADIDPYSSFTQLQSLARAPMAAYFKLDQAHLLCASPERFLRIDGDQALAQPIKGTAPRGKDEAEDLRSAERLRNDPKERAENIMIVDLVRNDLSRTAAKGSVEVEELCGIHAFPTVHQMISSIRSRIDPECSAVDVIRNAFPMGSMTGAPKVRAMELIEAYEGMRRGLYSGSVGYMDPEGNWDLNVVIRSLLYNERSRYLSAKVGGAITARSVPQKEYEECLLKAEALKRAIA